jgi:hypothetical protein
MSVIQDPPSANSLSKKRYGFKGLRQQIKRDDAEQTIMSVGTKRVNCSDFIRGGADRLQMMAMAKYP